jgi:hypothetical protein
VLRECRPWETRACLQSKEDLRKKPTKTKKNIKLGHKNREKLKMK